MNPDTIIRYYNHLLDQGLAGSRAEQHVAQRFGVSPEQLREVIERDDNMAAFEVDVDAPVVRYDHGNLYPEYVI